MVGDGTYMMMNSDIYSTVLSGHKMIVVVCDNGGFAVINRLQQAKGVPGFNNLLTDCRVVDRAAPLHVDFAKHAESMGAAARHCESLADFKSALEWAKGNDRTTVLSIASDAYAWVPGDADWDVGVPEVSSRESVRNARKQQVEIRANSHPRESSASECEHMKAKLGIAPIAWWNDDLAELSDDVSLEECLRQASVAGFTGMETGRRFPMNMANSDRSSTDIGISVCGGWFSGLLLDGDIEQEKDRVRAQTRFLRSCEGALHRLRRDGALDPGRAFVTAGDQAETLRRRDQGVRTKDDGFRGMVRKPGHAALLPSPHGGRDRDRGGSRPPDGKLGRSASAVV